MLGKRDNRASANNAPIEFYFIGSYSSTARTSTERDIINNPRCLKRKTRASKASVDDSGIISRRSFDDDGLAVAEMEFDIDCLPRRTTREEPNPQSPRHNSLETVQRPVLASKDPCHF